MLTLCCQLYSNPVSNHYAWLLGSVQHSCTFGIQPSDCWAAYNTVAHLGYNHLIVGQRTTQLHIWDTAIWLLGSVQHSCTFGIQPSDCWAAYNTVAHLGYNHLTVVVVLLHRPSWKHVDAQWKKICYLTWRVCGSLVWATIHSIR